MNVNSKCKTHTRSRRSADSECHIRQGMIQVDVCTMSVVYTCMLDTSVGAQLCAHRFLVSMVSVYTAHCTRTAKAFSKDAFHQRCLMSIR